MQYFKEAQNIWKDYVPRAGQASTVQGELLRAVEKLRDEAIRNGNLNWDEGFDIFISYLRNHLTDPKVYSEESASQTKQILTRLSNFDDPYLEDDLYDILGDKVVEYCEYYGSIAHNENPELYR